MLETVEPQGTSIIRGSAPDPGVFKASRHLNDGPLKHKATGVFDGHTRPQSPDLRVKPPKKTVRRSCPFIQNGTRPPEPSPRRRPGYS